MLVDLRSFASVSVLAFAALLTLAAIIGKLACAFATPKGVSGLTVGLGMMPRGEVGLIFARIGAQLALNGEPVVDPGTYAAAVFMVVATTMATLPLLLWSIRKRRARQARNGSPRMAVGLPSHWRTIRMPLPVLNAIRPAALPALKQWLAPDDERNVIRSTPCETRLH